MTKKEKLQELQDRLDVGEEITGAFWVNERNGGYLVCTEGTLKELDFDDKLFMTDRFICFDHFIETKNLKCILSDCED